MDNENIGTLVVQLKKQTRIVEQMTQFQPPRGNAEEALHDLIHTAAQAIYILSRDRK